MARDHQGVALREIGTLFRNGTLSGATDGALLDHYLGGSSELAEAAFTVLVLRHGPMVHRVCLGVLRINQDAEDAAQATFLALLKSAGRVQKRDSIASWLHGTALRIAACVRKARLRKERHEAKASSLCVWFGTDEPPADDLTATIHQEIGKLPEAYRTALVLCDLEGYSYEEAAARVHRPVGTIKSRVSRAREQLKAKLIRRGLSPVVGLATVLAKGEANASLLLNWAKLTFRLATTGPLSGDITRILTVTSLYQRSLLMSYIKTGIAGLTVLGVLTAGATLWGQQESVREGGVRTTPERVVTEVAAPGDNMIVKTYHVADIVKLNGSKNRFEHYWPLIDLLTSTTAAKSWMIKKEPGGEIVKPNGSSGTISLFVLNQSLVIRHTPEAHAQIAERLSQIRRFLEARDRLVVEEEEVLVPPQANKPATDMAGASMGGMPGPATVGPGMMGAMGPQANTNGPGASMGSMMSMMRGGSARSANAAGGVDKRTDRPQSGSAHPTDTGSSTGMMPKGGMSGMMMGSRGMMGMTQPVANEDDTKRRLESLEKKLDRLIDAMEKGDKQTGGAGQLRR